MLQLIPALAPILSDVVKRFIPDKDKQQDIERELQMAMIARSHELEATAGRIILAEAKSEHFLTASWRPILMLTITAIIAWNYLLGPLVSAIFMFNLVLELPSEMWTLLTVGVGGYTVGRSAEKVASKLKK
jgi:hypothetical protein